ncbi:MAG: hydantoinase B/oxoprolinase family protein [Firmicutes bacterium]|nr:hydantoinase B/oxoprolinase family protein [Bacillota bacterium]
MALVRELPPKEVDPVVVEVISNRIYQVILEAAQTLKRVSGAVLTVEAADFAIDLFDGEGNTFVYSPIGLPRQGSTVRLALPLVQQTLGEDPGIFPDDVIITNDPFSCTMHIVDLLALKPLYFKEELIMWIGVGIHKVDMGGMNPGISIAATNAYQEGLIIPPVKIIERGKLRKEIVNLYMANVRARHSQELDLRGQIAGLQHLDRRITEIVAHYGPETFKAVTRALQGYSEKVVRSRLATIPDGVYEFTDYLDHDGQTPALHTIKCRLTVEGDSALIDFTGTDPQTKGAANGTLGCTHGAIHAGLLTILAPDLSPNEGVFKPFREIVPHGSIIYTKHPAPCSGGATEAGYRTQCVFLGALNKACAAGSDELRRMSVSAEWGGSFIWIEPSGIDHSGREFTTLLFDGSGMGGGARSTKDGFGCACLHTTVGAQFQNAEIVEREYPLLYLKRSYRIDSCGPGRWRGGPGMESLMMTYDADRVHFGAFHNRRYPPAWGVFGGGPGAAAWTRVKRGTDVFGKLDEVVPFYPDLDGEEEILPQKALLYVNQGDVLFFNDPGGGGYGDPLEREPSRVLEDVLEEYITPENARRLYGVVLGPGGGTVDGPATDALREQMRRDRLDRARTALDEAWGPAPGPAADDRNADDRDQDHDQKLSELNLGGKPEMQKQLTKWDDIFEFVDTESGKMIQCAKCGHQICPVDEDWKKHVIMSEASFPDLGCYMEDHPDLVVWEFFCPSCALRFWVEVKKRGQVPDRDFQFKL